MSGVVIAAPAGYSGANALAMDTLPDNVAESITESLRAPGQGTMFMDGAQGRPSAKVVQLDQWQRQGIPPRPTAGESQNSTAHRTVQRRPAKVNAGQGMLDFIPATPLKTRKLKTDVDAQVFCDKAVATPTHRCVASAIDGAMILIGFGILALTFQGLGGSFGSGTIFWIGLGAALALVAMLYGLVWAIAGRETAGMHLTDLELITFDGFPLDGRNRALRFASAWLSFCAGGLGVFWAVADEENLTWHDHISKTFPTVRDAPRSFVTRNQESG